MGLGATSLGSVGQGPCFRRSNSFQSPKQKQTDKQKQKMKLKQGCVQPLVQSSERQITGNKNNAWPNSVTKPTNDFLPEGVKPTAGLVTYSVYTTSKKECNGKQT